MFDFLSSDWFIITIEVVFLVFIVYDAKKYLLTRKKEYLTNIFLTVGFFIWASIPFYNSYITWNDLNKKLYIATCQEIENNQTLCGCISKEVFKEFAYEGFDSNGSEYKEFYKETKEECLDDSWF